MSTRSIPLDDSIDDSRLSVDKHVFVDLNLPHYDSCPYWTYFMQDISMTHMDLVLLHSDLPLSCMYYHSQLHSHQQIILLFGPLVDQPTLVESFSRLHLEATFAKLWDHVGIGTMEFWGGSIIKWITFNNKAGTLWSNSISSWPSIHIQGGCCA